MMQHEMLVRISRITTAESKSIEEIKRSFGSWQIKTHPSDWGVRFTCLFYLLFLFFLVVRNHFIIYFSLYKRNEYGYYLFSGA